MKKKIVTAGVDLGGTKLEVGFVDHQGALLCSLTKPTRVKEGFQCIRQDIIDAINQLQKEAGVTVQGVGVGLAGQIDHKGKVLFAPNLRWKNVPLRSDLQRGLKLPTVITNDVRAATWGEWLHGAGRGCEDFICLFIGTGVGSGIVSGGKILTGNGNVAGELGHLPIEVEGMPCTCRGHGCLETFAGGWAIAERAKKMPKRSILFKLAERKREKITAKLVFEAASLGDPHAKAIVENVIAGLITGVTGIVNLFNPKRLIFGGGIVQGIPDLIERVEKGVKDRALKAALRSLEFRRAQLKEQAGVVGAASFARVQREER